MLSCAFTVSFHAVFRSSTLYVQQKLTWIIVPLVRPGRGELARVSVYVSLAASGLFYGRGGCVFELRSVRREIGSFIFELLNGQLLC